MEETTFRISVGLEQGPDGAILAHGLSLPGCTATGPTAEAAMGAFERAVGEWLAFLGSAGEPVPAADAEVELAVDEWVSTDADVAGGESTACFAADLPAVTQAEIERTLRLLGELRSRVVARVRRQPPAVLDAETPGGWTARRVLEELARAEWWTLGRVGASPLGEAPDSTLGRLDAVLALAGQHLGFLPAALRGARMEMDGEEWTTRKVLRRLLWLEWSLGRAAVSALAPVTGGDGG